MVNIRRLNLECYPSFITTKTNNYPFFRDSKNAELVLSTLNYGREHEWFYLGAFVIMPDHLHLVIAPRKKNISQAMHSIKSFSSNEINKLNTRSGQVWQPSFRDFTLYSKEVLFEKIKYIHGNPVRKQLTANPEGYEFSSANPCNDTDLALMV